MNESQREQDLKHTFKALAGKPDLRAAASLGRGLRTASGAKGRRGGHCHRAMVSTMSREERMSLQSELAAALAAGKSRVLG